MNHADFAPLVRWVQIPPRHIAAARDVARGSREWGRRDLGTPAVVPFQGTPGPIYLAPDRSLTPAPLSANGGRIQP